MFGIFSKLFFPDSIILSPGTGSLSNTPAGSRKDTKLMQVPMSSYLVEIKPLIRLLEREFDYVSVLCTDVKGTTYRVSMHQTTVGDYHFCERGFVVRAWQDSSYTEYSFNNLTDAADLAEEITSALKSEFQALKALGIAQMESPLVQEEAIAKTMQNEIEIDPETVSAEEILSHLRKLCDAGAAHEGILEFQSTVSPCQQAVPLLQKGSDAVLRFLGGLPFRNRHRKRKTEYVVPFLLRPERRGNLK